MAAMLVLAVLAVAVALGQGEDGLQLTTGAVDVQGLWSSVLWTRFPGEIFPLFLSDFLQAGKIQEAQAMSRVWNLSSEDVESYSGYITVNTRYHSNLFFWFCPAETLQSQAPMLLWLNGGPGRTSMVGALLENGPLEVDHTGTRLKRREVPWTRHFSMLYVDSPVDVGYSFTKDDAGMSRSLQDVTDNLYSLLVQFFQLFPQYSQLPFYVGGQSYAGKYVPALGYHIHHRNTDPATPRHHLINFKGIYVGAGFCDPINMMPAFPDYLYSTGLISSSQRQTIKTKFQKAFRDWRQGRYLKTTDEYLNTFFSTPLDHTEIDNLDNLLGNDATNGHLMNGLNKFMKSLGNRRKLHVGVAADKSHMLGSDKARDKLSPDIMRNTSAENAFLMDHYKVLHYSGNLDVIVSVPMTEAFLQHVQWSGQQEYGRSVRHGWRTDGELAGWVSVVRKFTRVVIRNSGHMAPYDQPKYTLAMMKNFVFDLPFES